MQPANAMTAPQIVEELKKQFLKKQSDGKGYSLSHGTPFQKEEQGAAKCVCEENI